MFHPLEGPYVGYPMVGPARTLHSATYHINKGLQLVMTNHDQQLDTATVYTSIDLKKSSQSANWNITSIES